ncbi:HIT domain-containing protein [Streptomyces sp. NPDC007110]|uniref:HIT family protein n=1 Tax=Streptomyces sp. NPDC007110 TaxID=3156916 RepID=UPI0033C4E4C4
MSQACPFCEIVTGRAPATIVHEWPEAIAIIPLNPVVQGHVLVLPREHVPDFTSFPKISAATMLCAAELVAGMGSYNLITSKGRPATQSVFHLHLHLVPRTEGDGLALPWHSGRRTHHTQVQVHPDPPHIAAAIRDVRRHGLPPRHT